MVHLIWVEWDTNKFEGFVIRRSPLLKWRGFLLSVQICIFNDTVSMKRALLIIVGVFLLFQHGYPMKKQFLRVFDLHGKKIAAGFLYQTTDSSIILKRFGEYREVPASRIGVIKTGRSTVRTVFIILLVLPLIILFIIFLIDSIARSIRRGDSNTHTDNNKTYEEPMPSIYEINGSMENWNKQRTILNRYLQ